VPRSEHQTRFELVNPALRARGWTEDLVRVEETAGAVEIIDGRPRKQSKGRVDYLLRVKPRPDAQAVAVALIEAKSEAHPPDHGLEQAKNYARCHRFGVPFIFATNGHLFVEYDRSSGLTTDPQQLGAFPSPDDLRARYEQTVGFSLDDEEARPLLVPYRGGETSRRYYQDAAIRAVLEKVARCRKEGQPARCLLSLATGSGKTRIAVQLLRRIADAGQLRRALFVCDRDELRSQAYAAFHNAFGNDAAPVSSGEPQKNARVLIATYQTLGVATDDADAGFLLANYPEDYFSHIVIDECHRSAWGKWSIVLKRNPSAVQIGLTATPRKLKVTDRSKAAEADAAINRDNLTHFGDPVYNYDISQGIEDGYLAACEVVKHDIFLEGREQIEAETGVDREDLEGKRLVDAHTGEIVEAERAEEHYTAQRFENRLLMPDRVRAMCEDLFAQLLATGRPEQKTVVFCVRDSHADRVATTLNNLYARWCEREGRERLEPYAFKCTAAAQGSQYLADLRGASRSHFVATTVDLLSTGVDVPCLQNVVFFRYVQSPIAFHQMVGRGTRLDPPSGKLMFRVHDYTDATRLLGEELVGPVYERDEREEREPGPAPEPPIVVEGMEVRVTPAGRSILTQRDGEPVWVTVEEYKELLAGKLVEEAPTLDEFRARWVVPADRRELLSHLPDTGRSPSVVRRLDGMGDFDLYDVLAGLAYGLAPLTRGDRAHAFTYKHAGWLATLPPPTANTLAALAGQFARAGTEGLEHPQVFQTPEVKRAGGLGALEHLGRPADVLHSTKERLFAG